VIDAELVTRKCLLIVRDLEALRPLAAEPRADYIGSTRDQAAAERYLERMIERMIDVNYHLLVDALQSALADVPHYISSVNGFLTRQPR
jgi:hypothetical protein